MKKKNGFTLVELLAVIVVLALIMVLAIPAVLDTMNKARKQAFVEFADDSVRIVQTRYVGDSGPGGAIQGAGFYVYNFKDLGKLGTGNYEGYVVVDASNVDDVRYIITMWDKYYQIINYDTTRGLPTTDSAELQAYSAETISASASDPLKVCTAAAGANGICYDKNGYKLTPQS